MDFETMVRRGLGRAVLYAQKNDVSVHRDFLLDACLHNPAFDPQWEMTPRGVYMFNLVQATHEAEFYSDALISALEERPDNLNTSQIYMILSGIGHYGDQEARKTLYDAFAQYSISHCFYVAKAIVKMDGVQGLVFVLERFVGQEFPEAHRWRLSELLRIAVETDEEESALDLAVAERPALAEMIALTRAAQEEVRNSGPHIPRFGPTPDYAEITRLIQTQDKKAAHTTLTRWGTELDNETIERLAKDALTETDPEQLHRYLYLFEERVFPLNYEKLLSLALDDEYMVARAARIALGPIASESVRELAVKILMREEGHFKAIPLLSRNYREGDWALVESVVARDLAPDDYHDLVIDVRGFFKEHFSPDAKNTLLQLYERGPCSLCRSDIVEDLLNLGDLPDWMLEECSYDASEETRDLVWPLLHEEDV